MKLRHQSLMALSSICLLAVGIAGAIAFHAVRAIESHYGASFARNYAIVIKQRIVAPVNRELALALRLARSEITKDWIKDESNEEKRRLFFREAEGYRTDFLDQSLFIASAISSNYYFNDGVSFQSDLPRYPLSEKKEKDAWFFKTLKSTALYDINVSPDPALGVTKVWLNFLVKDGEKNIAIAGTGLDLSTFVQSFIQSPEPGVTTMALDANGAIQAHRHIEKIAYRSSLGASHPSKSLAMLLPTEAQQSLLTNAMAKAKENPNTAVEFVGTLDDKRQMIALSWSPELNWYVVAAADLSVASFMDFSLFLPLLVAAIALLLIALMGVLSALNRLLLTPITQLTEAATDIAEGHNTLVLPKIRNDEIGLLTKAFATMAERVNSHRQILEKAVADRTKELVGANAELALLSERDELTGLGNRRMLLARLKLQDVEIRKTPERGQLGVALLDIDHFKHINDTYGHEAGDAALVQLAKTIREQLRNTDVVGRWGGEEFLILLPGSLASESQLVMRRLVEAIAATPIIYAGQTIHIKASIGLAQNKPDESINALIQRADLALYQAKDTGRNQVILI
jgi:phosphoserine phosphatase RsbU/P